MPVTGQLSQLWPDALSTANGAAAGTIKTYRDDLGCCLAWLEAENLRFDEVIEAPVQMKLSQLLAKKQRVV